MNNVKLTLQYFEIMDEDFTGIIATITQDNILVAKYQNFEDSSESYANQTDEFAVPSVAVAMSIIESNEAFSKCE